MREDPLADVAQIIACLDDGARNHGGLETPLLLFVEGIEILAALEEEVLLVLQ